jgi:hypothetical protein
VGPGYCLGCNYDLRGLPEPRCPECGRAFDPNDPKTFREEPRERHRAWIVVAIYMLPLVLSSWVWMTTHPQSAIAWSMRLLICVRTACGPIGWVLPSLGLAIPAALLEWGIWLLVVTQSRLLDWRYRKHFFVGFAWVFGGCVPYMSA